MRNFEINKLVRDGIPDRMEKEGAEIQVRNLTSHELDQSLREKLIEEAHELQTAENIAGELADALEVINILAELHGISIDQVEQVRQQKLEQSGGFTTGTYIESIALPEESPWVEHYASRPDKYPETS